jgi:uncharacterized protein (DUF58 family)
MVEQLRMDVASVVRELEVALKVLTEAKIMSRYRRVFKGKGLEFEDFREYTTNDDASEIDWKASKRANRLLVRRFKEERDMNVFLVVDVSSTMLFGSTKKLKHEYAAELTAALAHLILQSGDKVSLVMFSDGVVNFVEPGKGTKHLYILLKNLLTAKYYGGEYDMSEALEFLMSATQERSMLFLISDFIGLRRGWERTVKLISGKFDCIGVILRDPRDKNIPSGIGQVVISDPFSDREMLIDSDDKGRREYEHYVSFREEKIKTSLKAGNWDLLELSTAESFITPVIKFLKRRESLLR